MTATRTSPAVDGLLLDDLRRATTRGVPVPGVLREVETALLARWAALDELADALTDPAELGPEPSSRILHAGTGFSVVALTLPPSTATSVHDHLTWCVVAVVRGREHETTFRSHGTGLDVVATSTNPAGDVSSLVPPGDIHRVRNVGSSTAVSVHVYGADLRRAGSSVRRVYDLPITPSPR